MEKFIQANPIFQVQFEPEDTRTEDEYVEKTHKKTSDPNQGSKPGPYRRETITNPDFDGGKSCFPSKCFYEIVSWCSKELGTTNLESVLQAPT